MCELDIIFNFEKAYFIFDEFILGGEVQETSKKSVLKAINDQDVIQEVRFTSAMFVCRYSSIFSHENSSQSVPVTIEANDVRASMKSVCISRQKDRESSSKIPILNSEGTIELILRHIDFCMLFSLSLSLSSSFS